MRRQRAGLRRLVLALLVALPASLDAGQTYDLIFRQGTLADLPATEVLTYRRALNVPGNEEMSARGTGEVQLRFEPEDLVRLSFHQGEKHGTIGTFPAQVGNPVVMYFVETVLRDVAQVTGGSPFYLRNRIKESLLRDVPVAPAEVTFGDAQVPARTLTLHPFAGDENDARLGAYADLALTFTLSDTVPGWYVALSASAPAAEGGGYSSALTLLPDGVSQ